MIIKAFIIKINSCDQDQGEPHSLYYYRDGHDTVNIIIILILVKNL